VILLYSFWETTSLKSKIQKVFNLYVSEKITKRASIDNDTKFAEEKNVSMFFSDIQGFTSMSEKLSPQENIDILNEYFEKGLRLIQIEKSLLHTIPALLDDLAENPLKFILFIDDLSFVSNDKDFTALKTVLEGSVAARSDNVVVYATSNRRHLVNETFGSRQGDEIHLNDTLEEVSSLSARFGIVITFGKPDRDLFVTLVMQLAEHYGLSMPKNDLIKGAEAYAIRSGGRSPRVARQYVEYKIAMEE
jgi:predicted AAA+ superfamily ATPase